MCSASKNSGFERKLGRSEEVFFCNLLGFIRKYNAEFGNGLMNRTLYVDLNGDLFSGSACPKAGNLTRKIRQSLSYSDIQTWVQTVDHLNALENQVQENFFQCCLWRRRGGCYAFICDFQRIWIVPAKDCHSGR